MCFAGEGDGVADHCDDVVGVACCGDRFLEHRLVGSGRYEQRGTGLPVGVGGTGGVGHQLPDVGSSGVGDGPVRGGGGAESVEHGRRQVRVDARRAAS